MAVFNWAARAAQGQEVRRLKALAPFKTVGSTMGAEKCFKIRFQQDGECLCRRGLLSAANTHRKSGLGIVHPIPAFHRKLSIKSNWKTPKDISFVASRLAGSTSNWSQGWVLKKIEICNFIAQHNSSLKKKLEAWRGPGSHGSGGSRPRPPLSLRAHLHLMNACCLGKISTQLRHQDFNSALFVSVRCECAF